MKSQQLGNRMRKVEDACGLGFGETVYFIVVIVVFNDLSHISSRGGR